MVENKNVIIAMAKVKVKLPWKKMKSLPWQCSYIFHVNKDKIVIKKRNSKFSMEKIM